MFHLVNLNLCQSQTVSTPVSPFILPPSVTFQLFPYALPCVPLQSNVIKISEWESLSVSFSRKLETKLESGASPSILSLLS